MQSTQLHAKDGIRIHTALGGGTGIHEHAPTPTLPSRPHTQSPVHTPAEGGNANRTKMKNGKGSLTPTFDRVYGSTGHRAALGMCVASSSDGREMVVAEAGAWKPIQICTALDLALLKTIPEDPTKGSLFLSPESPVISCACLTNDANYLCLGLNISREAVIKVAIIFSSAPIHRQTTELTGLDLESSER